MLFSDFFFSFNHLILPGSERSVECHLLATAFTFGVNRLVPWRAKRRRWGARGSKLLVGVDEGGKETPLVQRKQKAR